MSNSYENPLDSERVKDRITINTVTWAITS